MNELQQPLTTALDALIALNRTFRRSFAAPGLKHTYSAPEHTWHFRTLRLDPGRQTGKTTCIAQRLDDNGAVAICSEAGRRNPLFRDRDNVFTLEQALSGELDHTPYQIAYIDDARHLLDSAQAERQLLQAIVKNHDSLFVLLG